MRNYIILNNQNSNTISGLIIQELAPISKPLQRTQVETIDGRDGDIVTPLGYAAYNKKIKIGLYGNFDINEVIAYFATKGTVIFSNEPDKYYYYQIVDQIDYERLVRYRVATVTMHVQPFKYSATEGTITVDTSDTVSGEGSDIVLDGTAEAPFNTLRYKGNATQDDTPTPDNPTEIKVLTGNSTVTITEKNLLECAGATVQNPDRATLSVSQNSVDYTFPTPLVGNGSGIIFPVKITSGKTYTVRFKTPTTGIFIANVRIGNGNWASGDIQGIMQLIDNNVGVISSEYTNTFTANADYAYLRFWVFNSSYGGVNSGTLSDIQLELGNQATDYEPYIGQSYVLPFGDTYLAKVGDYADEPVKVDGTWYIRRAIGKVVATGTLDANLNWYAQAEGSLGRFYSTILSDALYTETKTEIIATHFHFTTTSELGACYLFKQRLYAFYGTSATTASGFKTWLASNNTTFYYPLATPTDEAITDQDLIDALDELYDQAHSYKDHTHITATAADGNAPAVLSVEVGEDNESTVTNAGNTTSRPIITIYGQGDIGMYINDVQVLDIALGDEQYITIDSVAMEAYRDTTANLKNRLVTGDYSKLALNAGANKIYFTGNVTKYEISKYSRWL